MADPKTEHDGRKLIVQLEIPQDNLAKALDNGVRAALWQGAIEYVIKQITPEMTEKLVMSVLGDALKSFSTWELQGSIKKQMTPMLEEVMKRPEVLATMRKKVEEGVNLAIETLPEKVKEQLIERAITGMTKAWREDR